MEDKSTCIYCGDEWYSVHYKNGYCHTCQQNGAMDREIGKKKNDTKVKLFFLLVLAFFILMLLSGCNEDKFVAAIDPNHEIKHNGETYETYISNKVTIIDINGDTVIIDGGEVCNIYRKKKQ